MLMLYIIQVYDGYNIGHMIQIYLLDIIKEEKYNLICDAICREIPV